jgi:hypothetical protein
LGCADLAPSNRGLICVETGSSGTQSMGAPSEAAR